MDILAMNSVEMGIGCRRNIVERRKRAYKRHSQPKKQLAEMLSHAPNGVLKVDDLMETDEDFDRRWDNIDSEGNREPIREVLQREREMSISTQKKGEEQFLNKIKRSRNQIY
jgi:hypothetical protein